MIPPGLDGLDLTLTGMTYRVVRPHIEKKLNRLDGVEATVNYATEKATVTYDPALVTPERLVETVESIGYGFTGLLRHAARCRNRRTPTCATCASDSPRPSCSACRCWRSR